MKLFSLHRKHAMKKSTEISLVAATLVGFTGITMATIGNSSIWFDEAFGAYLIKFSFADIFKFTGLDVHPPLYYWLLKLWGELFGTSDVALRSMSVFFAVVALIFGYLLIRKLFDARTALIALFFIALSPFLIRYAQEMRMYTMVLAIGLAGTYALYMAHTKPSRKRWIIYAVIVSLGMWTHYFTAMIWLGHWVWRALQTRSKSLKQWRQAFFTKQWVWTYVLAVGLFLPWLPSMIFQVVNVQANGFWIPPISPMTLPAYASNVFLYLTPSQTSPWLTILLGASVVLGVVLVYRAYATMSRGEKLGYSLLITSAIAPLFIMILVSMPPLRSTFIDRYILTAAVLLVAVIGIAIAKVDHKSRQLGMAMAVLLLAMSVVGIANVYKYGNYNQFTDQKSQTRQLIEAIKAKPGTDGQPIIANTPWVYYEAAQYDNADNKVYFINKYVEYKFGSLEMLRLNDMGKIKDLDGFIKDHPTLWYIGRPGDSEIDPPAGDMTILQRIRIDDSITGKSAYEAVQYRLSAE